MLFGLQPDEVMVYTGMFIVPVVSAVAGFFLALAVRREKVPVWVACLLFVLSVIGGMVLSFGFVWMNGNMLHGDGALAIIAAPITGAIVTVPVALIFALALALVREK